MRIASYTFAAALLVLGFSLPDAAHAEVGKITKRVFQYGKVRYWKVGADRGDMKVGAYGRKRTSTGLEIHSHLKGLKVRKAKGQYTIKHKDFNSLSVGAKGGYAGVSAGGQLTTSASRSKNLVLKKLEVGTNKEVIDKINRSSSDLKYFKNNAKARVVTEVWVVVTAELAEKIEVSGSVSIDYNAPGGINAGASIGGGKGRDSNVSIPSGAIYAYMFKKVKKWNKKKLKKTTIAEIITDQVGIN